MTSRLTNLKLTVKSDTMLIPMDVLKPENVMSTNRAHFPRLCVAAGFATGFAGGACTGLQAGSIMFL